MYQNKQIGLKCSMEDNTLIQNDHPNYDSIQQLEHRRNNFKYIS